MNRATILFILLFLLCGIGCTSKTPTTYEYMQRHGIETPDDMTPEHWNVLLKNIPKDWRSEIIEKLDRLHETAVTRAETLKPKLDQQLTGLIEAQWQLALGHIAECQKEYPVVLPADKKAEYRRETANDIVRYLDDRIRYIEQWHLPEGGGYYEYQTAYQLSARFALDDVEKDRLSKGEPFTVNPFLEQPNPRSYGPLQSSWHFSNHAAQALMFENRDEELVPLKTDAAPELVKLDLRIGDVARWDGSTSLQPVARVVAAHAVGIPWKWAVDGRYHEDRKRNVLAGYYSRAFDDELGGEYNRHYDHYADYDMQKAGDWSRRNEPPPAPETVPDAHFINVLKFSQTHQSYVNLIEGRRDLLFATRMPSEDEIALAKENSVELEFHPFARDAFVFLENRHNPVRDLSLEQIRDIFSGKITAWKQVGGFGGRVNPLIRDRNSGSEELMRLLVMKDVPVRDDFRHQLVGSMSGIFDLLERDIEGIGYSILYYERFMVCNPYTRTIRIAGVEPTPETVADGSYPLLYECVAVVRKDSSEKAKAMAKWLCAEEGARVVRETGYIPISPTGKP